MFLRETEKLNQRRIQRLLRHGNRVEACGWKQRPVWNIKTGETLGAGAHAGNRKREAA